MLEQRRTMWPNIKTALCTIVYLIMTPMTPRDLTHDLAWLKRTETGCRV